jgi:AraC family transcriptional regulator, regulatory protein of adaptative response / methylated-DNA-[protein]-cysteine methyltransferase
MNHKNHTATLTSSLVETPLGTMIAIANEQFLYLLEFVDSRGVDREIEKLCITTKATIITGSTAPIESIKKELAAYFNGTLQQFTTPIHMIGTPFQQSVWKALQHIPYGHTNSYGEQAHIIGNKTAFRAVANANGGNQLAIIIPCHRIINGNGKLGGYAGGINRKQWLLDFEKAT